MMLVLRIRRSQKDPRQLLAQSPEEPLMPLAELAFSVEVAACTELRFAPYLASTRRLRPTVEIRLSIFALPLRLIRSLWPLLGDVPVMPRQQRLAESGGQHSRLVRQGLLKREAACERYHTCYAVTFSRARRPSRL